MLPTSAPFLALLASMSLSTGVGAHQGFQPVLQPPTFHSLRSNTTSGHLDRRWLAVETGTGPGDTQLWPDKTITCAFKSKEDRIALQANFKKAWELWKAAGIPRDEYKWNIITKAECDKIRPKCLLIEVKQDMISSVGMIPANAKTGVHGPYMHLDDVPLRQNKWPLEINYAHEMGHAWGLGHEHQNPAFWTGIYNPTTPDGTNPARKGTAFGPNNFRCQNVPGYQQALQKANDKSRSDYLRIDADYLCKSIVTAYKFEFLAASVLPDVGGYYSEKSDLSQGPDDVDWDSIMLYATRMTDPPFLSKTDGSDIPFPAGPSPKDVQGIQRLYDANRQTRSDAPLLNTEGNPKQGAFKKLFCSGE